MNPWGLVAVLAAVSLSSCGLSSEKKAVIARAGSIHEFPVPRATLMTTLGLEKPGKRHDVKIRGHRVSSSETWQHPAGLTITAYDVLTRRQINEVLLGITPDAPGLPEEPGLPSEPGLPDELGLPDEPGLPDEAGLSSEAGLPGGALMSSPLPPSESFGRFEVKDDKKVLFRSDQADPRPGS